MRHDAVQRQRRRAKLVMRGGLFGQCLCSRAYLVLTSQSSIPVALSRKWASFGSGVVAAAAAAAPASATAKTARTAPAYQRDMAHAAGCCWGGGTWRNRQSWMSDSNKSQSSR